MLQDRSKPIKELFVRSEKHDGLEFDLGLRIAGPKVFAFLSSKHQRQPILEVELTCAQKGGWVVEGRSSVARVKQSRHQVDIDIIGNEQYSKLGWLDKLRWHFGFDVSGCFHRRYSLTPPVFASAPLQGLMRNAVSTDIYVTGSGISSRYSKPTRCEWLI
ncbi:MAG: hypothetical protein DCC75_06155 [Proteobacteria bacterium]|nr:MAG: hypothetical protein DCC75_06155 [Pseudomonadota bacterium]